MVYGPQDGPFLFYFYLFQFVCLLIFVMAVCRKSHKIRILVFMPNSYQVGRIFRNEQVVGSSPIASSIRKSRLPEKSPEAFFCGENAVLSLMCPLLLCEACPSLVPQAV